MVSLSLWWSGTANKWVETEKEADDYNDAFRGRFIYLDGKRNGKSVLYYQGGQTRGEGNFKDGKEEGKWFEYYENGQIEVERNYKDGVKIYEVRNLPSS